MRLYLSRRIGAWRIGSSIKLTWWNAMFIAIAYMMYYMLLLTVYMLEYTFIAIFYVVKWTLKFYQWLWRQLVRGIRYIIQTIKTKTAEK